MRFAVRPIPTLTLSAAAVLALAAPVCAAAPRDELLRFVPDDVAFCFVLQDLRVHAADLADSPFVAQVRQSPLGLALQASAELAQLDKADRDLRKTLGVGFDQIRDDLLGDAVVFAYRPGPPGKPEQEQGFVLVRARDAKVLADLVEKVNAAQMKDGTLANLTPVDYAGVTYYRRAEPKQTNYYYVQGAVLLFSGQEDAVRRAIDAGRKASPTGPPPLGRKLDEFGAGKAALALWVNPRAFDAGLEDKAAKAEGAEAVQQKKVLTYWKAVEGVAAWATLDAELHLSFAERVRADALPPAAQRLLAVGGRPSEAWRYFPDDALLACGVRVDAGALLELLQDVSPKEDAAPAAAGAAFGKDILRDVLSHIGPDWGFCVTAPPTAGKDWTPQAILVIRTPPGDDAAPVDQALLSAVHTAALLAVVAYNHEHPTEPIRLKSVTVGGREVHFLAGEHVFPPGVQPAYALTNGWMVFASAPDVITRFAEAPAKPAAPDDAGYPVLRVSLKAWRAYLKDRHDALAAVLAEKNQLTVKEMGKRLDDLIGALEFVDRLEIDRRVGPAATVVTLTVQTARPLKKTGGG